MTTTRYEPRRLGAALLAVSVVASTLAAQSPSPLPYETRFYTHDGLRLESYFLEFLARHLPAPAS
jgi:hypothetical protein